MTGSSQWKLGDRALASLAMGCWGAFIAYFSMSTAPQHLAKDFSWPWRAARLLLEGRDPYTVIQATGPYPFNVGLFYPLPAGMLSLPFAPLPPAVAGALFVGVSSALLAWGLTKESPHRLLIFAGAPFCMAAVLGQWSPMLTAAALLPALQFVCAAKPNIGLVACLYRPSWRGALGAVALVAISLAIVPQWPWEWREALRDAPRYKGPALSLAGLFTLLGVLRWRRREGRLFTGMALVPQLSLFYDQLPLGLIPPTVRQSLLFTALGWVAWFQWYPSRALTSHVAVARPWILALLYAPALVMLLMLPAREGEQRAPNDRITE